MIGVDSSLSWIKGGPHFPQATRAKALNPLVEAFVLRIWEGPQVPHAVDPSKGRKYLPTLWDNVVSVSGWSESADEDEEEEEYEE